MKKKIISSLLFLAFLLYPCIHELSSNSMQTKQNQEELQREVTVTLKLVQVFVADKQGNPVTDLTQSDFELYDNGELKKITDFEKHIFAKPAEKIKKEIKANEVAPAPEILPKINRKFYLLIDTHGNDILGIKESKKAALHFVDTQLRPPDEVAVLSYSSFRGILLHAYLTKDHEKTRNAIKDIVDRPYRSMGGPSLASLMASAESERGLGRESISSLAFRTPVNPEREFLYKKALEFTDDMRAFSKSLNYIPGYKNVIFFSSGIARSMLNDLDNPAIRESYEEMGKELAASNIPVYTVNASGMRRRSGVDSLKMLSDLSGGKFFHDVRYYKTIAEEIQIVTSNYYVLGYYIDEKWDGKYHEIKVKVKREGYHVHAQAGYFNPKPFTKFSHFEKQLHLFDLAFGENPYFQEPLKFSLVALPCSREKDWNLVFLSEILKEKMDEIVRGKAELATFIIDEKNNVVDSSRGEIDFPSLPHKNIYQYSIASLPSGPYEVKVVIRNLKTGRGAVNSASVVIPEDIESGMQLHQPLLLIPGKKAFYIKFSKRKEKDEPIKEYSLNDIYPLIPDKSFPLIDELEKGTSKLLAVMRCSITDIAKPKVQLSAHLIMHSSGEKIPLSFSIHSKERKEETDILLVEFALPELQPQKYSLIITAEEEKSKSKNQVRQTFRVR